VGKILKGVDEDYIYLAEIIHQQDAFLGKRKVRGMYYVYEGTKADVEEYHKLANRNEAPFKEAQALKDFLENRGFVLKKNTVLKEKELPAEMLVHTNTNKVQILHSDKNNQIKFISTLDWTRNRFPDWKQSDFSSLRPSLLIYWNHAMNNIVFDSEKKNHIYRNKVLNLFHQGSKILGHILQAARQDLKN
jgi:hypothetical protein